MYAKTPSGIFSATRSYWFFTRYYVTLIDKTDPRAPTKREHYWILTIKTKAPMGLMLKVLTELPSYIFILQIFIFVDLDGLLQDYSRFIWIVTFILFYHLRQYLYLSGS